MNHLQRRLSTFSHSRKASRSTPNSTPLDTTSPVPHLLKSNAPPTDAETAVVRHAIDNASTFLNLKMQDHDHGAASPRERAGPSEHGVLSAHEQHFMQKSTEFIRDHKALLSPLRRLPHEVLAVIFEHNVNPYPDHTQYPWVPSQVCRAWRAAALSNPHLWSHIRIDFCAWDKARPRKHCVDFYKMLLERSAGGPLYIYICSTKWSGPKVDKIRPIIDLLALHSERWESFNLQAHFDTLEAFQSVRHRVPVLNSLYLSVYYSVQPEAQKSVMDIFDVAPKLQVVHLSDNCLEFKLPWSQITEFKDGTCWCNDTPLRNVLEHADSIHTLVVPSISTNNLRLSRPKTSLSELNSFEIHYVPLSTEIQARDDSFNNLLNSLTLPAVKSISITNYPENPLPVLSSLLSRSLSCTCKLQTLSIGTRSQVFSPGELTTFLREVDFVVKLAIAMPHAADLASFVVRPDHPVLLPHLQYLHIAVDVPVFNLETTLNEIASTRFLQERPQSSVGLASPLVHMRLMFPDGGSCHLSHERLEQDVSQFNITFNAYHVPRDLLNLRGKLEKEISQLSCGVQQPRSKLDMKFRHAYKLARVFSAIEEQDVIDVRDLYTSGIHHAMHHIATVDPTTIPGERVYHFQRRATTLLDQWAPMLLSDIPNRRWAFQGEHSIVYTPTYNSVRQDPDVLQYMIYGWTFSAFKYAYRSYDYMLSRLSYAD